MKKVQHILLFEYYFALLFSLFIVVIFETELLLPGTTDSHVSAQYYLLMTMEILTICTIPFSLYLFKLRKVEANLKEKGSEALLRWGSLRMAMIGLPMMANTLLYYLFMSVAFGYMAIILLLSSILIYPSSNRCRIEIGE